MNGLEFSILTALLALYGLFFFFLLILACLRGARRRRRLTQSTVEIQRIRDAMIHYLAGKNDLEPFRESIASNRRDFETALMTLEPTVGGGARERLCALVLELGLVHEWCRDAESRDAAVRRAAFNRLAFACFYEPCRRVAGDLVFQSLGDADRQIALLAARAVIHSADQSEIEEVFRLTVREDLLTRILLNGNLRRHAVALCERAVPEALASKNRDTVLATLHTLLAWERAIPLEHLDRWMETEDREIRLAAIRLAPFVALTPGTRAAVVRSLDNEDAGIATAAALSATRLRIEEALPQIPRVLAAAPAEVVRTAAAELAEMLPLGLETLEQLQFSANPLAAALASAALAGARRRTAG